MGQIKVDGKLKSAKTCLLIYFLIFQFNGKIDVVHELLIRNFGAACLAMSAVMYRLTGERGSMSCWFLTRLLVSTGRINRLLGFSCIMVDTNVWIFVNSTQLYG